MPWYLKVSKEGFDPVIVNIRPRIQPDDNRKTTLNVTVEVQPKEKSTR